MADNHCYSMIPRKAWGVTWFHTVPELSNVQALANRGHHLEAQQEAIMIAQETNEHLVETYASLFVAAGAGNDHELGYAFATKGFDAAKKLNDHSFWIRLFKANREVLSSHIVSGWSREGGMAEPRSEALCLAAASKVVVGAKKRIGGDDKRKGKKVSQKLKLRMREIQQELQDVQQVLQEKMVTEQMESMKLRGDEW